MNSARYVVPYVKSEMSTEQWLFLFAGLQGFGAVCTFFRIDVRIFRRMKTIRPSTGREKVMCCLSIGALLFCILGFYESGKWTQNLLRESVQGWGPRGAPPGMTHVSITGQPLLKYSKTHRV